jgi:hypothetical protein
MVPSDPGETLSVGCERGCHGEVRSAGDHATGVRGRIDLGREGEGDDCVVRCGRRAIAMVFADGKHEFARAVDGEAGIAAIGDGHQRARRTLAVNQPHAVVAPFRIHDRLAAYAIGAAAVFVNAAADVGACREHVASGAAGGPAHESAPAAFGRAKFEPARGAAVDCKLGEGDGPAGNEIGGHGRFPGAEARGRLPLHAVVFAGGTALLRLALRLV